MGASNYKTIMPAMEQQDRSVLVQLLYSKVISYTRRYGLSNHPSQGGCEDYCPFPSCIQADLLFPKKQEYSHGPPNDNQSYQKKYGHLPKLQITDIFQACSSKVGNFFMRIDLGRFPPWLRSAACPLQVPLHGCEPHDIDRVGVFQPYSGDERFLWWVKIGEFPEVLWKGYSLSYVAGILLRVFCFGNLQKDLNWYP